jgi:hypothetical protein
MNKTLTKMNYSRNAHATQDQFLRSVREATSLKDTSPVHGGSVLVTNEGCLWYAAEELRPNNQTNVLAAILGYVPSRLVPDFPFQKKIELHGEEYKKAFGLPLLDYVKYLSSVESLGLTKVLDRWGRLVLLSKSDTNIWRDPLKAMPGFLESLPKVKSAVDALSSYIHVSLSVNLYFLRTLCLNLVAA